MKIVEQSAELLSITPGALFLIERCGRVCYKSEEKLECKRCPNGKARAYIGLTTVDVYRACPECVERATAFIKKIIKSGHESVLEHAEAVFLFITDRGITHETVRHRIGVGYSQESTRYCNYGKKGIVGLDPGCGPKESQESYKRVLAFVEEEYNKQIDAGIPPEFARRVLPIGIKTEIAMSANFRAWRHVLKLRATNKRAHPQIRLLMKSVLAVLREEVPAVFGDIKFEE